MPRHFFFLVALGQHEKCSQGGKEAELVWAWPAPNLCKYATLSEYVWRMASESGITESDSESNNNSSNNNNSNNYDNNNNNSWTMSSHVRNADNQLDARWKAATPFKIQANPRLELALSSYPFCPRLDASTPWPLKLFLYPCLLILQEFHVWTFGYFVLSTWCLKLEYSYECGYKYESTGRYSCKYWENLHNFLFFRLQEATCAARITGLVEHGSICSPLVSYLHILPSHILPSLSTVCRLCIDFREFA